MGIATSFPSLSLRFSAFHKTPTTPFFLPRMCTRFFLPNMASPKTMNGAFGDFSNTAGFQCCGPGPCLFEVVRKPDCLHKCENMSLFDSCQVRNRFVTWGQLQVLVLVWRPAFCLFFSSAAGDFCE